MEALSLVISIILFIVLLVVAIKGLEKLFDVITGLLLSENSYKFDQARYYQVEPEEPKKDELEEFYSLLAPNVAAQLKALSNKTMTLEEVDQEIKRLAAQQQNIYIEELLKAYGKDKDPYARQFWLGEDQSSR